MILRSGAPDGQRLHRRHSLGCNSCRARRPPDPRAGPFENLYTQLSRRRRRRRQERSWTEKVTYRGGESTAGTALLLTDEYSCAGEDLVPGKPCARETLCQGRPWRGGDGAQGKSAPRPIAAGQTSKVLRCGCKRFERGWGEASTRSHPLGTAAATTTVEAGSHGTGLTRGIPSGEGCTAVCDRACGVGCGVTSDHDSKKLYESFEGVKHRRWDFLNFNKAAWLRRRIDPPTGGSYAASPGSG